MNTAISSAAFHDTKPHYLLLDALRGVAALMVMIYHIFEGFATSPVDQHFNHGYLAVDFFFIISGFVIGFAYNDRFKNKKITLSGFFKRRLIRLHPMVIIGAIIGAATFCIQGCVKWDGSNVSLSMIMLSLLFTMLMIPSAPSSISEIRGNGEMFPLNGPSWSLFFEYIANIFYALAVRKMSTKALKVLVALLALALICAGVFNLSGYGHMGMGWTFADHNFWGGLIRMMFSYSAGILISRLFRPLKVKGTFLICTAALFLVFACPHIGSDKLLWLNGLYDSVIIILVFPLLLYIGASATIEKKNSVILCRLLGDISYPLYMVHYPIMYLFYAWLWKGQLTLAQAWPVALCVYFGSIILAYICLKLFDEPIRRGLTNRFLPKGN